MIVQSSRDGRTHFVMTMQQHTTLAGEFARHFGNADFAQPSPREPMLHLVSHHDAGWQELDDEVLRDPATGLPFSLVATPFAKIVETSARSPDRNGEHHPFCELLSSMHSYGLYNGRYGLSDKVLLDDLAAQNRPAADAMLQAESQRQARLRERLAADPETAPWVQHDRLMQNYQQLQFFDTLALYFNCVPEGRREATSFAHVPRSEARDTDVGIRPVEPGTYTLEPYPFDSDTLSVSFCGRTLTPAAGDEELREANSRAPLTTQTVTLVRE